MMTSQQIDYRSDSRHSRWFMASNARAHRALRDSQSSAAQIRSPAMQPATAPSPVHQRLAANQLPRSRRADLLDAPAVAKSP
jgi:hypothetical protein